MVEASAPVPVSNRNIDSDEFYRTISVGDKHAVALTSKGQVMTWGCHGAPCNDGDNKDDAHGDGDGRLGFNTTNTAWWPHDSTGGSGDYLYNYRGQIIKALAGADFTMVLTSGGKVLTMGANDVGQLGNNDSSEGSGNKANELAIPDKVIDIDAAGRMAMALTDSGQVYYWGQLGNQIRRQPTKLLTPADFGQIQNIAAGQAVCVAGYSDVGCWNIGDSSGPLRNITNQLRYPTYGLRASGQNLDRATSDSSQRKGGGFWLDYNGNKIADNGERALDYQSCGNDLCMQFSADMAEPPAGKYPLYAWTGFGSDADKAVADNAVEISYLDSNNVSDGRWGFVNNPTKVVNQQQSSSEGARGEASMLNDSKANVSDAVATNVANNNLTTNSTDATKTGPSPTDQNAKPEVDSTKQISSDNSSLPVNSLISEEPDDLDIPLTNLTDVRYNRYMEEQVANIKQWLGTGSVNIFGIQFSGKDTLGVPLAKALDGTFLSSGDLVRSAANNEVDSQLRQAAIDSQMGILTPTEQFRQLIVPKLEDERLAGKPLVLGSVGRWIGEEEPVMAALNEGRHPLKAVIVLHIPEDEIWRRWEIVKHTRNGGRADDRDRSRVKLRLKEFKEKTLPVIKKYRQMGYVIDIDASGSIEQTYQMTIAELAKRASQSSAESR